jgi:hypothetical protein
VPKRDPRPITPERRREIIARAVEFCRNKVFGRNLKSLEERFGKLTEYKLNPFTEEYIARLTHGDNSAGSAASSLLIFKVQQSLATTLGTKLQEFCSSELDCPGSMTSGLDMDFWDFVDERERFSQVKLGPATINDEDVDPMREKFTAAMRRARRNNLRVSADDFVIGVMYGKASQLNPPYRRLERAFPIFVGQDFWTRVTGDASFYTEFSRAIMQLGRELANHELFSSAVAELTAEIEDYRQRGR